MSVHFRNGLYSHFSPIEKKCIIVAVSSTSKGMERALICRVSTSGLSVIHNACPYFHASIEQTDIRLGSLKTHSIIVAIVLPALNSKPMASDRQVYKQDTACI